MPSNGRLLNMVLRVLLCNWLLAVVALAAVADPAKPMRIVVLGDSLVAGFQLKTGRLTLADHDRLAGATGLELVERWSTWDRRPWSGSDDYAVSVHRRAS